MKKVLATLAAVAAGGTLVACGSAPEKASTFTPQTLTAAGATFQHLCINAGSKIMQQKVTESLIKQSVVVLVFASLLLGLLTSVLVIVR